MNLEQVPNDLPIPKDDGACDHLEGMKFPDLEFGSTDGNTVNISKQTGSLVIYIYPMTGRPDVALPEGWNSIPGARGCTPQSCSFRDLHDELKKYATVYGLSTQSTDYQQEAKSRLHLPFELLSDTDFLLKAKLSLPTFNFVETERYRRITLIIKECEIKKVFYPIFPPDKNAEDVLNWFENKS